MIYLMFGTAFALSAVAAYYSIYGLTVIFAAAVIPIILMGSTLEVAKLVVASWLYHNWKEVPILMRTYFTIALIILMTLTSMGIFGFLSKAHLDQAVPSGDIAAKVALIDEKIKIEKDTINEARKTIEVLNSQVNETLNRTSTQTNDKGVGRSITIRKNQSKERNSAFKQIEGSQTQITKLNEERAPIASQLRKVEAEVGPIKYIAALIYGDNLDTSFLEKAVRIVILMIVSVFDPLAVLMLVAANWSLKHRKLKEPDFDTTDLVWDEILEDFNSKPEPKEKIEWPEDEDRIDVVGQNGNEGLHYNEPDKDWDPKFNLDTKPTTHAYLDKNWEWVPIPSDGPNVVPAEQSLGVTSNTSYIEKDEDGLIKWVDK